METGPNIATRSVVPYSGEDADLLRNLADRIAQLEQQFAQRPRPRSHSQMSPPGIGNTIDLFPVRMTGERTWKKQLVLNGTMGDWDGSPLNCSDSTSACAAITLTGTANAPSDGDMGLMMLLPDSGAVRAVFVPMAKTFLAKITTYNGSFPQWSYSAEQVVGYDSASSTHQTDGNTFTCYNGAETSSTASTWTYGNGVTVNTAGQVDGTTCVIVPIGAGALVEMRYQFGRYTFSSPNSAEVP